MQRSEPLLSIIIPCFNYEDYVSEAIESVLRQECVWVEIVVVDDGSTDSSWERIQNYIGHVVAIRQRNGGALSASLAGFSRARGKFVYFLDADDKMYLNSLCFLRDLLIDNVSKIQFQLTPVNSEGRIIGPDFPNLDPNIGSSELINSISQSGFYITPPTSGNIYRRDLYENLGDLHYDRAIDGVSYLLAPFLGDVVSINKPLGYYRIHDKNLSSFSKLSSARMNGYSARFSERLRHLDQLLKERDIHSGGLIIRNDYFYLAEMKIFAHILDGKRPGADLSKTYVRGLKNEAGLEKRAFRIVLLVMLLILPNAISREVVELRINQGKFIWLRTLLKKFSIKKIMGY